MWEDNIREWTGREFGRSQRAVENRGKWRKLVAISSVVPQRPSWLRDWWWWWSFGVGMLPRLEISGINLGLIDDMSALSTTPWSLPPVRLDLATFKKRYNWSSNIQTALLDTCFWLPWFWKRFYRGPKSDNGVDTVAVTSKHYHRRYTCRLPNDSSVFTPELRDIPLTLRHVYHSKMVSWFYQTLCHLFRLYITWNMMIPFW